MLGLDVPVASQPRRIDLNETARSEPRPSERIMGEPSLDSLREKSFSGLDSFLEPEPTNTGLRRILLLMVLLVALGGAGWWTYTNYIGAMEGSKPEVATTGTSGAATTATPQPVPQNTPPSENTNPASAATPSAQTSEIASGNASTAPDTAPTKTPDTAASPAAETKTAAPPDVPPAAESTPSKRESPFQPPPKRQPAANAVRPNNVRPPNVQPANLSSTAGADTGDADFRRGEAYLYGRGAAGNCDQAVKSLKAASAKSNAKARSAFGTMYATGHCVPRDLPTSYLWFAMALRIDPNNQILEKDLNAIWNQMTPPERQMATRMKE
jgi:cytoskeletal protein RodZ